MFKPGMVVRSKEYPDCFCELLEKKGDRPNYFVYRYHPYSRGLFKKYVDRTWRQAPFHSCDWVVVEYPEPLVDEEYESMLV